MWEVEQGMIPREKVSRKCGIKFFPSKTSFSRNSNLKIYQASRQHSGKYIQSILLKMKLSVLTWNNVFLLIILS